MTAAAASIEQHLLQIRPTTGCVWLPVAYLATGRGSPAAAARSTFLQTRGFSVNENRRISPPRRSLNRLLLRRMASSAANGAPISSTAPMAYPCCQSAGKKDRKKRAYIALGGNLGDRIGWIEKACREMDNRDIRVLRTSSLWETAPMYVLEQEKFANGVCEVETELEPLALLDQLQDIERTLGRKKVIDKGPRNIDLDILLYENREFKHERLIIPHIGIAEREFVLRPLAQLAPDIPVSPARPWKLVQDYLNELPPQPEPLTPLTPLGRSHAPLQALRADRRTKIMAILNVTPDSFSDGGNHSTADQASLSTLADTVRTFFEDGATVIDVGGQSTAPGRPQVSAEDELNRVVPAIKMIRANPAYDSITVSVDTYRASVAEAAVAAGADVINDVSAGAMDTEMLSTMARLGVTVCLMHMRGTPETMSKLNQYGTDQGDKISNTGTDIIEAIARELVERVAAAEAAGVRRWRIVLDPGLGFAKVGDQNVAVLRHLRLLREWPGLEGLPWLVGSSRKKFIGRTTGVVAPAERVWGTAATVAAAVLGGADIVRAHDVSEMRQVVAMADAIWRY